MSIPQYVLNAHKVLNTLWSTYRGEKIRFPKDAIELVEFGKKATSAWKVQSSYTDPRDAAQRQATILFIPMASIMNTEIAVKITTYVEEKQFEHVILVSPPMSRPAKNVLQKLPEVIWEPLSYDDLKVCVMDNELVPRYRLMSNEECKQFKPEQMRKMQSTDSIVVKSSKKQQITQDPIARMLGLRTGDMVEITEFNPYTIVNKSYRVLV